MELWDSKRARRGLGVVLVGLFASQALGCLATGGNGFGDGGTCVNAQRLFFEDFETGNYDRWTSGNYGNSWGNACQSNAFSTDHAVSGTSSHRSEVVCSYGADTVHRGYGGMQFSGDTALSRYTNQGSGIDAPFGIVITFWGWLEVPYSFGGGRWWSPMTTEGDCGWAEKVVGVAIDTPEGRLLPSQILQGGGTIDVEPGAAVYPLGQWVRTTAYVNYVEGEMHVWQDGNSQAHANFTRATKQICQFHWGLYASSDNTDIVYYEDDISIHRLNEPWTDFSVEPWLDEAVPTCP